MRWYFESVKSNIFPTLTHTISAPRAFARKDSSRPVLFSTWRRIKLRVLSQVKYSSGKSLTKSGELLQQASVSEKLITLLSSLAQDLSVSAGEIRVSIAMVCSDSITNIRSGAITIGSKIACPKNPTRLTLYSGGTNASISVVSNMCPAPNGRLRDTGYKHR